MAARKLEIRRGDRSYADFPGPCIFQNEAGPSVFQAPLSWETELEEKEDEIRELRQKLSSLQTKCRITSLRLRVAQVQADAWKDASQAWRAVACADTKERDEKARTNQAKAERASRVSLVSSPDDLDRPKDG